MCARRFLPPLASLVLLGGCPKEDYARIYRTEPHAPSLTPEAIARLDHLGPKIVDQGTSFTVYSEHATRIELLLFDDPEAALPTRQFPMHRFGDVWSIYVEGIGLGQHYGYIAFGPNWPYAEQWFPGSVHGFVADVDAEGNRFNPNKLLLDPYAKAIHRDHDWAKGSLASGPARAVSTFAAASKSVVVESRYAWSANETAWRAGRQNPAWPGHRFEDLILYEVHLKGFTAGAVASEVLHPGTYRGAAELAGYLADLGVTAVELMPVFEKPLDGGYWGYQTLNFFAPELAYATPASRMLPGAVTDEFKEMVDVFHQHGLEVVLDVVYNHTGEGGFWREKLERSSIDLDPGTSSALVNFDPKEVAGIYSYRGLDNQAYYALTSDNQTYWNDTGVGNQTRTNHVPMRRLIRDSLRYWVEELHVDGFRFDLAPILGMKDRDYGVFDAANTVLGELADDPVLVQYNTRLIAEPWAMGAQGYQLGGFPKSPARPDIAFGEWNGNFRDWWRTFLNDVDYDPQNPGYFPLSYVVGPIDGGGTLTGSFALFGDAGDERRPYHSVNFITAHDGFTLYDLFTYAEKQNGCGSLNLVCCPVGTSSPFCNRDDGESHNRSRDWGQANEPHKRQMMRNAFVAMLISHGAPMILGGDEWQRTQLGNNNAYSDSADVPANWLDWGTWSPQPERQRMRDFVRQMISLRKAHADQLAPATYGGGSPFAWKDAANQDKSSWADKQLVLHYYDGTLSPQLCILINLESLDTPFTLPAGVTWHRVVDTQSYFDLPEYFDGSGWPIASSANITLAAPTVIGDASYVAKARSIVILEEHR
jgi:glycogen operon protein